MGKQPNAARLPTTDYRLLITIGSSLQGTRLNEEAAKRALIPYPLSLIPFSDTEKRPWTLTARKRGSESLPVLSCVPKYGHPGLSSELGESESQGIERSISLGVLHCLGPSQDFGNDPTIPSSCPMSFRASQDSSIFVGQGSVLIHYAYRYL